MPTKEQLAASELYANIMAEIKIRIGAIDAGTGGNLPVLAPQLIKEFAHLQIRFICELIALGCLVAHGDIIPSNKKSLQTEWSADLIVKALSDLHPDFFPIAMRQKGVGGVRTIEPVTPPVMTKQGFLELYGRCGGMLHRGNVKKLLRQKMPVQVNYPEITAKAQKFVDLLSNHMLTMKGGGQVFLCLLHPADDPANVHVSIAEKHDPPEQLKAKFEAALRQARE